MTKPLVVVAAVYTALCIGLWPVPLLGLLHVESSAVVAGVGFFASGLAALALFADADLRFRQGAALWGVMGRLVLLLLVPLALLLLSLLWRPNCGWPQGLFLFGVFTVPSVVLAVALAWVLDATVRRRRTWFVAIGVAVAVVPVAWDLGLHPQFYTYNHVWGGILGPIYDEELAVRPGLFWFRGLSLLWAAALVLLGTRARARKARGEGSGREDALSSPRAWALLAVIALIGLGYVFAPRLGINTPGWLIRERLGGHLATERFDIYYDPASLSEGELQVVADAHAYRYHQLWKALGVDVGDRIATYLYPDADTKAALTGARQTSVAPVWLPRPQMHLLLSRFDAHFGHELVHVFSREFGLPVLRASPAVGLVEGLAVALEPPDGLPPADAQVAAATRYREDEGMLSGPLADAVAARLGPLGFWTGRGAVSYTTAGSFVRYLYRTYGAAPVRAVYATGDFAAAFGVSLDTLAARWQAAVLASPPDPEAEELVARVFTRPSLFEQRCPHWVAPWKRAYRAGLGALAAGDAEEAAIYFERALADEPAQPAVLAAWGRLKLAQGEVDRVVTRLRAAVAADTLAGATLWSRLGDAYALVGAQAEADSAYAAALDATPSYWRTTRAALALRRRAAPEAVEVLLGLDPAAVRAERLAEVEEPAAQMLAALLWTEAGDYAAAQVALERVAPEAVPEVAPERFVWLARFTYAAGDRLGAVAYAERAARAYDERGAAHAADQQRDLADALWWVVLREDPVLALPAARGDASQR